MISTEIKGEGRRFAALLFSLGLLQIAGYYFAAAWVNGPGPLATPQPDTLLYCQAARRIVEGHAFSFSAGSPVCTGTTSVLYPFVLAVPYALGFTGGSLLTAGFALNALFYLIFLFGWAGAFRRWCEPKTAAFASLLLALFPQAAYCACAQSDTGLWMAVSAVCVYALAAKRTVLLAICLALGPWVRPEGALIVAGLGAWWLANHIWRAANHESRAASHELVPFVAGVVSIVGVMLLNRHLSGVGGFSSVADKGFFTTLPFATAVVRAGFETLVMCREIFFGQTAVPPRVYYAVPLLGAVAFWWGVCRFDWKRAGGTLAPFGLAALGGLLVVAQSGWQGSNVDRYMAWSLPLFVLFEAAGWRAAAERATARGGVWAARAVYALPFVYGVATSCTSTASYHAACATTECMTLYAQEIARLIPNRTSVGMEGWCGAGYWFGECRIVHLGGIYSPAFAGCDSCEALEVLAREKETRFDHWVFEPDGNFTKSFRELQGETTLAGPGGHELRPANWAPFDVGAAAPGCAGKTLKARVDVCYKKDEQRADYEIVASYGMPAFKPFFETGTLNGTNVVVCGRLIAGYDEMTVDGLEPGKDVAIVLRTTDHATGVCNGPFGSTRTEYAFGDEIGLHVGVDGRDVACLHVDLHGKSHADETCHEHRHAEPQKRRDAASPITNHEPRTTSHVFRDVVLHVPGKAITQPRHRFRFHGDHVAFSYWFYQ